MIPDVCFNAWIVNKGSNCILLRNSDQSFAIHRNSLHNETTEQHENYYFFFFNMIECDWSTWLVRQKVDSQTPQSIQTLSIDWPLDCIWALLHSMKCNNYNNYIIIKIYQYHYRGKVHEWQFKMDTCTYRSFNAFWEFLLKFYGGKRYA